MLTIQIRGKQLSLSPVMELGICAVGVTMLRGQAPTNYFQKL